MPTEITGTTGVSKVQDGVIVTADIGNAQVTQAKLGTNVAGNGPAFRAYNSAATSITTSMVKVDLQTEEFDTGSAFDTSRFTPQVAGYYQFDASVQFSSGNYVCRAAIYKNGAAAAYGVSPVGATTAVGVSGMLFLNGTTDYVELFAQSGTTQNTAQGSAITYMSGFLARSA